MTRSFTAYAAVAAFILATVRPAPGPFTSHASPSGDSVRTRVSSTYAAGSADPALSARHPETNAFDPLLTARFVENRGQWEPDVSLHARQGPISIYLGRDSFVVQALRAADDGRGTCRGTNLRFTFEDADTASAASGDGLLGGRINYLRGADASRWITDVRTFERGVLSNVRPGISAVFHQENGTFEYDLDVLPGADLKSLVVRCDGADRLYVDAGGALIAMTSLGPIRQDPPRTHAVAPDGSRRNVESRFRQIDATRFGFDVPDRDPREALLVDPAIVFGGLLSGSNYEFARCIALDQTGNAFVAGRTASTNFPRTPGAFDSTFNNTEGFVSKLNPAGNALIYSTYLGSNGADDIYGIALDSQDRAVVTGRCGTGFPVTSGAYDATHNGFSDTFVAKLNAAGNGLVFGTYIGGSNDDIAAGLALDAQDNVYVCGTTLSPNFPTTSGALFGTPRGDWDGWVLELNPTATALVFSTRLGGSGYDSVTGVAVGSLGEVVVAGSTTSADFPTTPGVYDRTFNGGSDVFVARIGSLGSSVVYSTFIGGAVNDQASAIAIDHTGRVLVTGQAYAGFPTTSDAHQTVANGGVDVFLLALEPDGSALSYSTFFGGSSVETGCALAVSADDSIFVAGFTSSLDFPVTSGAVFPNAAGGGVPGDGFVTKFLASGQMSWSTYIAGNGADQVRGIAVDGVGSIYLAGTTTSTNLPTTSVPFAISLGLDDGFFYKIDMGPAATASSFGTGCAPSGPPPSLDTAPPVIGQPLDLTGDSAPPGAPGIIVVGTPATFTLAASGCAVYVNYLAATYPMQFTTDAQGSWSVSTGVPQSGVLAGGAARMQAVFLTPGSPWGYELSQGVQLQFGY